MSIRFQRLLCLVLLPLAGCSTVDPPGQHWDRAPLGDLGWQPLHGVDSLAAGDGDYAYSPERLALAAPGRIESKRTTEAAAGLAYAKSARENGQAGSAARSVCEVMQSFGALVGAN